MPVPAAQVASMSISKPAEKKNTVASGRPADDAARRTETKAITIFPVTELLAILPKHLHGAIRSSKFYTSGSDCLTFQAQTHRSRSANVDENRRKLNEEVIRIFHEMTPNETSTDKVKKHQNM
jgi:peptidyl-tRNA hydrolase ICT1